MPGGFGLKLRERRKALDTWFVRRRYFTLLALLLLTLCLPPLMSAFGWRTTLIEGLFFINLATAALGAGTKLIRRSLLAIIACAGAMRVAGRMMDLDRVSALAALLWILIAVIAAVRAVRFAMRGRSVDMEHICAALSAYMLAGHLYGFGYLWMERLWPGSFTIGGAVAAPGQFDLQTAIYFSFVTIATLGYGDIAPLSGPARGFAVGEALLGQFYLAVLVARLVGGYANRE